MKKINSSLNIFCALLLISSCAEPQKLRFATNDKSETLQLANYVASYLLAEGYNTKVEMVATDDPAAALAADKVDVVLEMPAELVPQNSVAVGTLIEGTIAVKVISKKFQEKKTLASEFIERMIFRQDRIDLSLAWAKNNQQNLAIGATYFINGNQSKWRKWGVDKDREESIKVTLKKDVAALHAANVPL